MIGFGTRAGCGVGSGTCIGSGIRDGDGGVVCAMTFLGAGRDVIRECTHAFQFVSLVAVTIGLIGACSVASSIGRPLVCSGGNPPWTTTGIEAAGGAGEDSTIGAGGDAGS